MVTFILIKERWYHRLFSKFQKEVDPINCIPVGWIEFQLMVDGKGDVHATRLTYISDEWE